MTDLSVIVPTRDRRDVLLETLARLEGAAGRSEGEIEVVVVDDGSRDETGAAVRAFAQDSALALELLEQENAGPAAARNRGVAAARGEVCLFLGDDTWPREDLLAHHLAFHRTRPAREDALLGLVVWAPGLDRSPFMRWLTEGGVQFEFHNLPPGGSDVGGRFFYTSNVSVKAELLRAAGGFDESFRHAAGEDIDLGLRLERAGIRIAYEPRAVVEHYHPTDLEATLRRMWTVGRASAKLAERYAQRPRPVRPGLRHRVKAAGLTALALAPARPRALREETWRFLCHEAFREAFWAEDDVRPQRLPRIGSSLVARAARDAADAGARARGEGPVGGIALNQLVRFEPVLGLVRDTGGRTLLDVGSGSAGLAPWLGPEWAVTAIDTSFDDYGGASGPLADEAHRLLGDARRLPFDDRAFDVTVALDLIEHVAPGDRSAVLAELARVTARRLIVAGPAGRPAFAADERLAELYRRRLGRLPGWLEEHLEHGFPEPEEIAEALCPHGEVRLLGNETVAAHERLMRTEARRAGRALTRLACAALAPSARERTWAPARRGAGRALRLVRGRDRPPTYRTIAVLDVHRPPR